MLKGLKGQFHHVMIFNMELTNFIYSEECTLEEMIEDIKNAVIR